MASRTKALLAGSVTAIVVLVAVPASIAALHAKAMPMCARNQLAVRSNGTQGAVGTIYGAYVLTNVSKTSCTLMGYPSVHLFGRRGRPIRLMVKRDLAPTARMVTLAPGGSATFRTSYSDVSASKCPVSSVIQIMPPHVTKSLFIPATLSPCRGQLHVSAVRAGVHHA